MTKSRASIFDEPEEPKELDVSGFAPKSAPDANAPAPEKVRAVAEAAHFSSREPKPQKQTVPAKRAPRRHRTGRNVQLNLKASQETVDAFYAISDKNDWVLGETLEMAIQSLQRELQSKK
jgi:hypothetical protein